MRISDWSSDVCSSDLFGRPHQGDPGRRDGGADELDQLAEERHGPGADAREAPACRGLWSRSGRSLFQEAGRGERSEEHTSELQSLMRISYAVFCLIKKQILHLHLCSTQPAVHL